MTEKRPSEISGCRRKEFEGKFCALFFSFDDENGFFFISQLYYVDIEQSEGCDGDFDCDQKMLKPSEFLKVIPLCK